MTKHLGPVLQFRSNADEYCVSAMVILDIKDPPPGGNVTLPSSRVNIQKIADIPFQNPSMSAWRMDMYIPLTVETGSINYEFAEVRASFSLPKANTMPRIAYASCNGFSDEKLMKQVDDHNERWRHLGALHATNPYQLLLLGGDQVYSDSMWKKVPSLAAWVQLSASERQRKNFTNAMAAELDEFFCRLYLERWSKPEIAHVMEHIPSVMMWDDHDIMDGWGSYPAEQHDCRVFQGIFEIAQRYFRLFQLQCSNTETHPAKVTGAGGHSLAFKSLGNLALLVPDLRSERQPANNAGRPEQIIAASSWDAIFGWMESLQEVAQGHMLVMSSIPVAYLDLGAIEKMLATLPGQQELEDDLRDHWMSEPHLQERKRLVHRLFQHALDKNCRITILSGDVHVGALSVLESSRDRSASREQGVINQLVSTGIVHPAPPAIVRYVLENIAGEVDQVDHGITATMLPVAGRRRYLIGARNWLAIEPDAENRLWCNWHVEGLGSPLCKVIHPVN